MNKLTRLKEIIIGKPLNILNPKIKDHIALIAIIAWIGLGSDGLSSSAYGPEEAFLALGTHHNIGIFLAFATTITVFLIALSYNQVIELFPHGGGGYQVASHLLSPTAGAISGSALIVDYILTISVSSASGVDALFSLIPKQYYIYNVSVKLLVIMILILLNLRGVKESINVLIPLFLGFLLTHVFIIVAGLIFHEHGILNVVSNGYKEFHLMSSREIGTFASIALLLKAFSLGGGTYTGLEAVSNNVSMLAKPRVRTGKLTMLYMAISLSFTASGIILLYLLWHATPEMGKTLNAVVFSKIINVIGFGGNWLIVVIMFFEAALLFVAANTGFLAAPAVMANMANDKWLPHQFSELSSRLVTQNGILIAGVASLIVLICVDGRVSTLVVLYSINVFITFALSLLGLSVYGIKVRKHKANWFPKFILASIGFIVCTVILIITLWAKFTEGGWLTIVITTGVIVICFLIKQHYQNINRKLDEIDTLFAPQFDKSNQTTPTLVPILDKRAKTAVFFVTKHYGAGLHAVLTVGRLFPNVYKNYVFLNTGAIDSVVLSKDEIFKSKYRISLNSIIESYRSFCSENDIPSAGYYSYGVDEIAELLKLAEKVNQEYSNCVFFAGKLIFINETWWTRLLHNNTVIRLQRLLHLRGMQMVILPMKI